jgi:uncharacterized integral membrane protein
MARKATSISDPVQPQTAGRGGVTLSPKMICALVILVAALWFIFANRTTVRIKLWIPTVLAPLWLVLLITFCAGMLTGLLVWRGKRQK